MKKYSVLVIIFFATIAMIVSCKKSGTALEKIWETDRELRIPESVMYDPEDEILYVSNINGNPADKDGNGFITKLGLDGKIVRLKWVEGLDAPKGMGIFKGSLYVTDIDNIVQIDIKSGKIIKRYKAAGAQFLNDIAIDDNGVVYITDTNTNRIYRLMDGKVSVWRDSEKLVNPNGLAMKDGKLIVGINNAILSIDLKNKSVSVEIEGKYTGGTDGLKPVGKDKYIISDWAGKVRLVGKNTETVILSDTTGQKINAADLEYIPGKNMILIPTFFDNRVVAYKL